MSCCCVLSLAFTDSRQRAVNKINSFGVENEKKRFLYIFVLSVLTFCSIKSHAGIVYSGVVNQTCNEFADVLDVDFNHDGNLEIRLGWHQVSFGYTSTMAFSQVVEFRQFLLLSPDLTGYDYEPAVLDYGHIIGSETTGNYSWNHPTLDRLLCTDINNDPPFDRTYCGKWNNQTEKYLGCKIDIDSIVHFGWIQLSVDAENNVTLVDYAYENNSNTAILAGHIPEPATISLLALGGLTLLRRRK